MTLNLKKEKTESMVFGGWKRLNSHCGDLNIEYKMFLYLLSRIAPLFEYTNELMDSLDLCMVLEIFLLLKCLLRYSKQ